MSSVPMTMRRDSQLADPLAVARWAHFLTPPMTAAEGVYWRGLSDAARAFCYRLGVRPEEHRQAVERETDIANAMKAARNSR